MAGEGCPSALSIQDPHNVRDTPSFIHTEQSIDKTLKIHLPAQYHFSTPLEIQDLPVIMDLSPHTDSILEFTPAWMEGLAPSSSSQMDVPQPEGLSLALRGKVFSLMVKMILESHRLEGVRRVLDEPNLPGRELKFIRTISTPLIPPGADPTLLEGILSHTRDWLHRCYRANERFFRSSLQEDLLEILREGVINPGPIWHEACEHADHLIEGGTNSATLRKILRMFPIGFWAGLDCFTSVDLNCVPTRVDTREGPMLVREMLALEKRSWQEALVFRHPPCSPNPSGFIKLVIHRPIVFLGDENLDTLPLVFRRPVQVNIFPGMNVYNITTALKLLSTKFEEVSRALFVFELPLDGSTRMETYRSQVQNLKTMAGICFPNANLMFAQVPLDGTFPTAVKERIIFLNKNIRDLWECVRPLPGEAAAWTGSRTQWKFGMGAKAWSRWRPYLER